MTSADARFHTTRWSMVVAAQGQGDIALEELCAAYWYPLYAFARRSGLGVPEAQDVTQSFFARLLEKQWLQAVDPDRGKFRSFLMMAMKRFLANDWKHGQRLKRGGQIELLSLDWLEAEQRYQLEPPTEDDGTAVFDRRWALTLLERTLDRLEGEQKEPQVFETLKPALTAGQGGFDCATAAAQLSRSEGAVRVLVHRLRKRYRELFREEIAQTVAEEDEIEEEIRYLIEVLARG